MSRQPVAQAVLKGDKHLRRRGTATAATPNAGRRRHGRRPHAARMTLWCALVALLPAQLALVRADNDPEVDLSVLPDPTVPSWAVTAPRDARDGRWAGPPGAFVALEYANVVAVSQDETLPRACAIRNADGRVVCWGKGLSASSPSRRLAPPTDAAASLAYADFGDASCWLTTALTPVCTDPLGLLTVPATAKVPMVRLACSFRGCCGLRTTGALVCWAWSAGESYWYPPSGRFVDVSVSRLFAAAVDIDGGLHIWRTHPAVPPTAPLVGAAPLSRVYTGPSASAIICGIRRDTGLAVCEGSMVLSASPPDSPEFVELSIGPDAGSEIEICGIDRSQGYKIVCWNAFTNSPEVPGTIGAEAPTDLGYLSVAVGRGFACAVKDTQAVTCWPHSAAAPAKAGIFSPPVMLASHTVQQAVHPRPLTPPLGLQKALDPRSGEWFGFNGHVRLTDRDSGDGKFALFGNRPDATNTVPAVSPVSFSNLDTMFRGSYGMFDDNDVRAVEVGPTVGMAAPSSSLADIVQWGDDPSFTGTTDISQGSMMLLAATVGLNCVASIAMSVVHCWGSADNPAGGALEVNIAGMGLDDFMGLEVCFTDSGGLYSWAACAFGKSDLNKVRVECVGNGGCATDHPTMDNVLDLSCGTGYCCAIEEEKIRCWGSFSGDSELLLGTNPPGTLQDLSAGHDTVCTISHINVDLETKEWVTCYPPNGDANGLAAQAPPDAPIGTYTDIAVGVDSACVIEDRRLRCWGNGFFERSDVRSPFALYSTRAIHVEDDASAISGAECWPNGGMGPCTVPSLTEAATALSSHGGVFAHIIVHEPQVTLAAPLSLFGVGMQLVSAVEGGTRVVCDLSEAVPPFTGACITFHGEGTFISGFRFEDVHRSDDAPDLDDNLACLLNFGSGGNSVEDLQFHNVTGFSNLLRFEADATPTVTRLLLNGTHTTKATIYVEGDNSASAGESLTYALISNVAFIDSVAGATAWEAPLISVSTGVTPLQLRDLSVDVSTSWPSAALFATELGTISTPVMSITMDNIVVDVCPVETCGTDPVIPFPIALLAKTDLSATSLHFTNVQKVIVVGSVAETSKFTLSNSTFDRLTTTTVGAFRFNAEGSVVNFVNVAFTKAAATDASQSVVVCYNCESVVMQGVTASDWKPRSGLVTPQFLRALLPVLLDVRSLTVVGGDGHASRNSFIHVTGSASRQATAILSEISLSEWWNATDAFISAETSDT